MEFKTKYNIGQKVYQIGYDWLAEDMFKTAVVAECVITQIRILKESAKHPWYVEYYCETIGDREQLEQICLGVERKYIDDEEDECVTLPMWGGWIYEGEINISREAGVRAVAEWNTLPF